MLQLPHRLENWFERRSAVLAQPRAAFYAALLVPLLCALQALLLGQDDGWDMRNYHLYNPYALLNGRLAIDMSPAGFQTYFNPLLDLPYYLLTLYAPAPLAGAVFGALHGLNFIPLAGIARLLLPGRQRVALLLALAGCLGAGFLSELGNCMGDNLTSLLVLSSLYMVLRRCAGVARVPALGIGALLLAGLLMGAAAGLKPTNVNYAVALCLALLLWPLPFWRRIAQAWWFGVGVLAGMAATAGYWWLTMWQLFGNPLFPQFNNLFASPLAAPLGVLDAGHLPRNPGEALLWPFIFTRDIARIAEVPLRQLIWPLVYVLIVAAALHALWCWWKAAAGRVASPASTSSTSGAAHGLLAARVLLVFFVLGYLIWLKLFSIYRYLVPLELLAPLLVWLLLHRLFSAGVARRLAGWSLLLCAFYTLPFVSWGHGGWSASAFRAEVPSFARPESTVVYMVRTPMAWLTRFFQPQVAFLAIGSGFPESAAYVQRLQARAAARTAPPYVMLPAAVNIREAGAQRKLALARSLGLTASPAACARLDGWLRRVRFQVEVQPLAAAQGEACTLVLQAQFHVDLAAQDAALENEVQGQLARYGLLLDAASCVRYPAFVGTEPHPYRLCRVMALNR